jgi:LysM repeat protein
MGLVGVLLPGAAIAAPAQSAWHSGCAYYHTVQRGQTLAWIASYYGVNLWSIAQANGIQNPNHIYAGQNLCIPGGYQPPAPKPPPPAPPPANCCGSGQYTVQYGDTLAAIAWRYGTTVWQLVQLNGLPNPNCIYVGQVLKVPGNCCAPPPPPCCDPKPPCCGGGQPPPVPPPQPQPVPGRWLGVYYNNATLSGPAIFARDDADLNFNWGTGGPGNGVPEDNFSVVWTREGYWQAGNYRFLLTVDDGARVYVDNTLVLDVWRVQPATNYFADVNIPAGNHTIRVEYFEAGDVASIALTWARL